MKTSQTQKQKKSNPLGAGRKWFDGKDEKEIIAKLEECTALDASIEECLFYADISRDSYYRYLKANPEFAIRLEALRNRPVLKAKQAVVKSLDDPNHAFKYLEKKRKKEFGNSIDLTSGGETLDKVLEIKINQPNGKKNTGDKSHP